MPSFVITDPFTIATLFNIWKNSIIPSFSISSIRICALKNATLTNLDGDEKSPGSPIPPVAEPSGVNSKSLQFADVG